jgi:hypothetical protein
MKTQRFILFLPKKQEKKASQQNSKDISSQKMIRFE